MMTLLMKKKTIVSIVLLTFVTMLSFLLVIVCLNNAVKANDGPVLSDKNSIYVSSVEVASAMAGFNVATPSPESMKFNDSSIKYSIDVNQLVQLGDKPAPYFVGQNWEFSDGSTIRIIQSPCFKSPNIGEPIDISGTIGKRVFFKAESDLPPRIALYWTNGNVGYSLFGTLTETVSEEILISIANSVQVR